MTVFISRSLASDSPFKNCLEAAGCAVRGFPLIELTPLPVPEIPEADWIFFASPQAVSFFFRLRYSGNARMAALGPGTAAAIRRFGRAVDFSGSGEPHAAAEAFLPLAKGQRVLFPAARHSQQSLPRLLGTSIEVLELPLYDNAPIANPPMLPEDVLAFTSPMNAAAYFAAHLLQPHQQVVAIGRTTAAALAALGVRVSAVAAAPGEFALAASVLSLRQ